MHSGRLIGGWPSLLLPQHGSHGAHAILALSVCRLAGPAALHSITVARYPLGPCLRQVPLPRDPSLSTTQVARQLLCPTCSGPVSIDSSLHLSLPTKPFLLLLLPPPPLRITSTPPFLFALSLFLPSWCVPASSPSLLVIILWPDNQNFPIIAAFTRPTAQIAIQKKRLKKEASGKAHHKIILILVFYLRTYHPLRCHCSRAPAGSLFAFLRHSAQVNFQTADGSNNNWDNIVIRPRKQPIRCYEARTNKP